MTIFDEMVRRRLERARRAREARLDAQAELPAEQLIVCEPPTLYSYTATCPTCGFKQEYHTLEKPEHAEYSMTCRGCSSMDQPESRTNARIDS